MNVETLSLVKINRNTSDFSCFSRLITDVVTNMNLFIAFLTFLYISEFAYVMTFMAQ